MLIVITGWFDKYDRFGHRTGTKEHLVSHGIDSKTDRNVIMPCEEVTDNLIERWKMVYLPSIMEYVIFDSDEEKEHFFERKQEPAIRTIYR